MNPAGSLSFSEGLLRRRVGKSARVNRVPTEDLWPRPDLNRLRRRNNRLVLQLDRLRPLTPATANDPPPRMKSRVPRSQQHGGLVVEDTDFPRVVRWFVVTRFSGSRQTGLNAVTTSANRDITSMSSAASSDESGTSSLGARFVHPDNQSDSQECSNWPNASPTAKPRSSLALRPVSGRGSAALRGGVRR